MFEGEISIFAVKTLMFSHDFHSEFPIDDRDPPSRLAPQNALAVWRR